MGRKIERKQKEDDELCVETGIKRKGKAKETGEKTGKDISRNVRLPLLPPVFFK